MTDHRVHTHKPRYGIRDRSKDLTLAQRLKSGQYSPQDIQEAARILESPKPELIRLYPTPWYVSSDGIKTSNGIWVMTASNIDLAHKIVELANSVGGTDKVPS